MQLPPVQDIYVYENARIDGRPSIAPNLWREHFDIFYLDQKMRCPDDIPFAQLCDRVGINKITTEDVSYFESRVVTEDIPEELDNENFKNGTVSIIVTTNEDREAVNLAKLRALLPMAKEYTCLSNDKVTNRKNQEELPEATCFNTTNGGMMKNLIIREGAPVMITTNHQVAQFKEDGLTNGAFGYIDFIQVSDKNPEVVEIIWVVFRDKRVGKKHYKAAKRKLRKEEFAHLIHEDALPILPSTKEFKVKQGNVHYMRKQFALTLAYAMTAHKSQGASKDKVIVDFRGSGPRGAFIDKASFYTAITRVSKGSNLFLRSFKKSFIRNNPAVEFEINRMRQLRSVKYRKVYLGEQIFEDNSEVKVGYLNINGLCEGYHAQYLNGDLNLQNLDLFALAETHLQNGTNNATLVELLSNWQVQFRFDSGDGKKHMGLLILTSKSATDFQLVENLSLNRQGQTQVQVVSVSLSGKVFSFVYIRTTPTLAEAQWLQEKTLKSDYILGDLNLNPLNPNEERLIEVIGGQKKMIFRGVTTPQKNQLDHILGDESAKPVFATSYLNFISDHFAITLRMSLTGAGFVDDPRLKKDSSQIKRPIIHQSPVSTPKRSQRKPAAGTPTKKRRC